MGEKLIVLFTSSFPYIGGEQFIESEIDYLADIEWGRVIICPSNINSVSREVPSNIKVHNTSININFFNKILFAFKALTSRVFLKEIFQLILLNKISIKSIIFAWKTLTYTHIAMARAKALIKENGKIDIAYCYWNDVQAYAACLLKRQGYIKHVVSRSHRFDLYEDVRPIKYQPLKRQFRKDFDRVFVISDEGRHYFQNTYGFDSSYLDVARLGVQIPNKSSGISKDGILRVLSVSYCVQVKRIDKIIEAINYFGNENPCMRIEWTHIGDGPLRQSLENSASGMFAANSNISFAFLGMLKNTEVFEFYEENPVDIFINTSESEGVPVSIMEAMSFSIPAIAPAVGGIAELVDDSCGVLLSSDPSSIDIAEGINKIINGQIKYRENARSIIERMYNKEKNYKEFLEKLKALDKDSSVAK